MIRCIAIDDEPIALEVIKKYTGEVPFLYLAATFTDAIQAAAFLRTTQVDLLFLDINMPDITGIQLVQKLKPLPMFIFTTAYAQYAVKGYELEALDYLVKPFRFERFFKAVTRAEKQFQLEHPASQKDETFLLIKSGYKTVKILLRDILYIEGLDDYIKIHLPDKSPILSLTSMKSVLDKLPVGRFLRVHRSYIVPVDKIRSIRNKKIYLEYSEIPIGETYMQLVSDWMKQEPG